MRQAGTIASKQDAERFADYLLSLGINSKVDGAGDAWAIWIHDENQVPRSREELERFEREPHDARYQAAEHTAKLARRTASEKLRKARKNFIDLRNEWTSPWRRRPVTIALVVVCVLIYLARSNNLNAYLYFSSVDNSTAQIVGGQVWRLVTPIFLHFGFMHLLFNMWWLFDLGTLIERRLGLLWYALLILAIAIPSNFAQFNMAGPNFGGMSGVVYGLFGYAWVRGRLDPTCGLHLRPDVAFWLMAWFVLCALGMIGNVANWAHGGGLAMGAGLAYLAQSWTSMRKKP